MLASRLVTEDVFSITSHSRGVPNRQEPQSSRERKAGLRADEKNPLFRQQHVPFPRPGKGHSNYRTTFVGN